MESIPANAPSVVVPVASASASVPAAPVTVSPVVTGTLPPPVTPIDNTGMPDGSTPQTPATTLYSDLEYGKLLQATVAGSNVEPVTSGTRTASILNELRDIEENEDSGLITVRILDVLDRGVLLLDTREELKLRGVEISTQKTLNDMTELYARRAGDVLRTMLRDKVVQVKISNPVRDTGGNLLGTVYLGDGTNVNNLMISRGYGKIDPREITAIEQLNELGILEALARTEKIGVWSLVQ